MEKKEKMKLKDWELDFPVDERGLMCFSSCFIAPRHSGKTTLILWLIQTLFKKHFDDIMVFTTLGNKKAYSKIMNRKDIFVGLNHQMIEKAIDFNSKLIAKGKKPINVLVVCDDTCSMSEKKDPIIKDIYMKGRHSNISIIYVAQSAIMVDSVWKENSDLIFIFNPKSRRRIEYIVDNLILGVLDKTFESGRKERNYYINLLYEVVRKQFRCMIVDYRQFKLYKYLLEI